MFNTLFTHKHLKCLSAWAGIKVHLNDDFEIFIQSDVDFIELLLLFEKHFALDLLETDKTQEDFSTIKEFVSWALEQTTKEPVGYAKSENLPFAKHLRQRDYICQQVSAQ